MPAYTGKHGGLKSPTNLSGLAGVGRTAAKYTENIEEIAAANDPGQFAPVPEAHAQMEETWKKASDDQVLMISDSDMDPHEFSAQNRGKFTERSHMTNE
jgi:hypothetical protein